MSVAFKVLVTGSCLGDRFGIMMNVSMPVYDLYHAVMISVRRHVGRDFACFRGKQVDYIFCWEYAIDVVLRTVPGPTLPCFTAKRTWVCLRLRRRVPGDWAPYIGVMVGYRSCYIFLARFLCAHAVQSGRRGALALSFHIVVRM